MNYRTMEFDHEKELREFEILREADIDCSDVHITAETIVDYISQDFDGGNEEKHLFIDYNSGIRFMSTFNNVLSAEYNLNRNFIMRGFALVDEWNSFLGIDSISKDYPDIGWDVCSGIDWIDFRHKRIVLNGIDAWEISFIFSPEELEEM